MNKHKIILISIIFLGFILRLWKVDQIPPGLNRDEAAIGYSSFSVLKTGKDEYGVILPLSFKSFGDWKLPLYIYSNIASTRLLGLNELSVRLPSVVFGTLAILILYFLVYEIFRDYKYRDLICLVSAFLLSISPWHIHFSRVTSEANFGVFLVSFSLLLFFRGINLPLFLPLSSAILALSLYSYHGNHIFTPLIFTGLFFILFLKKIEKRQIILFTIPFVLLSFLIYQKTIFSADKTKISGLSYLSDKYLVYEKISLARVDHDNLSPAMGTLFHNKLAFFGERFVEGYLKSFSPEFLFLKGGGNLQHNIPNFGNLYIWEMPFILLGVYFLFSKRIKWRHFLLFWFLISPIPAAITRDAPHSARMLSFLPLPHVFAALGFVEIITYMKNRALNKYLLMVISFVLIINLTSYLDRYFIHFPKMSEAYWGGGYKDLVSSISQVSENFPQIIMDRPDYSPYIYFLFYQKTDPATFQKGVIRYPDDSEGFQHVKSFGNIEFKKLDWSDDLLVPGRLLVTWAESTPLHATNSSILVDNIVLNRLREKYGQSFNLRIGDTISNRLIKVIRLKNGVPQFYLIEIKKNV